MQKLVKTIAALMMVMGAIAGGSAVAAQDAGEEETIDVVAAAYSCDDTECAEGTTPLAGTTITSFTADGTELDSCTTDDSAGQCELTIPAAEDGTYSLVPPSDYADYVLLDEVPQTEGQEGDGRTWTFVPAAADDGAAETDESAEDDSGDAAAEGDTEADATAEVEGAADDEVGSLPSTGSGQQAMPSSVVIIAGSSVLAMLALAVALRMRRA
jgi:hypothetical protein